jgi:hypothetical protein
MSDKYLISNGGVGVYDIWEHDENGQRVQLIASVKGDTQETFEGLLKIVREMNRLERLITDSVNMARLTDRTNLQHAMLREDIGKGEVSEMNEVPDFDSNYSVQFITVRRTNWNRMVRAFKAVSALVFLP